MRSTARAFPPARCQPDVRPDSDLFARLIDLNSSPRYGCVLMCVRAHAHITKGIIFDPPYLSVVLGSVLLFRCCPDIDSTALLQEYDASQTSLDLFGNNATEYDEEYATSVAETALDRATDAITVLVRRVRRHSCWLLPFWCLITRVACLRQIWLVPSVPLVPLVPLSSIVLVSFSSFLTFVSFENTARHHTP